MKLSTAIAVLSATATLAAPASDVTLDKRATTGVYLCNDRDWQGYCVHINSPPSECVPLAGDLNDPGCSTAADFFHVGYPGVADLSKTPVNGPTGSTRNFEDKLSSYFCVNDL
jgi:hypothetical protein